MFMGIYALRVVTTGQNSNKPGLASMRAPRHGFAGMVCYGLVFIGYLL